MLNLKKIAITGLIASGKSTLCNHFETKNAKVINADEIGHELLNIETDVGRQILDLLGPSVLTKKRFDRKKIASIVFNDKIKLRQLESLLHPLILQEIEKQYDQNKNKNFSYFVVDIPLLFEMNHQHFYDYVILLQAKEELIKKRFMKKGFSSDEYRKRTSFLMPIEKKRKEADFILDNDSTFLHLYDQLDNILEQINQT